MPETQTTPTEFASPPKTLEQQNSEAEEMRQRRLANRQQAQEVLDAAAKQKTVKIGTEIVDGKERDMTIDVPRKLQGNQTPATSDRVAIERFIKRYMVGVKRCALTDAHEVAEARFGYTYRV